MPTAGPFYSYAQLEQLWIQNGGPAAVAPIAAAVAMAESGGGAGSTNPTDNGGRQTSWGAWQISDGTHNQPVPNILDPNVNAAAAVAKYRASGWRPWGTFTSGAYRRYLQNGVPPSSAGVPAGGAGAGASLTSSSSDAGCLITIAVGCLFTKTEARALIGGGLIVAGGLVTIVGVVMLLKSESAVAATRIVVTGLAGKNQTSIATVGQAAKLETSAATTEMGKAES